MPPLILAILNLLLNSIPPPAATYPADRLPTLTFIDGSADVRPAAFLLLHEILPPDLSTLQIRQNLLHILLVGLIRNRRLSQITFGLPSLLG